MRARAAGTILGVAGAAVGVRGQEVMQVSYSWSEVVAGTLTPVASPNSVLEPGEGARIGINIFATINGTNAIGQTIAYSPPPPPGIATVRGIAYIKYNLNGSNGAAGSWNDRAISPVLSAGAFAGTPMNGGATLDSLGGGQFVAIGQTANATNPIADAFRGVWNPTSYQQRTVNFRASNGTASGPTFSDLIAQYGSAFVDPTDPTTEYALYVTKGIITNYGGGVDIPIAPGVASGLPLALAGAAALRRRRPT